MQMYEVTALSSDGTEEVCKTILFAEDEDDALDRLLEQLEEEHIAHGMCYAEEI